MKNNNSHLFTDPVCGMTVVPEKAAASCEYKQQTYYFCNLQCKKRFAENPELYLNGKPRPAVNCCCCNEAFEDSDILITKKMRKLRTGFVISALITTVMTVLNYSHYATQEIGNMLQFILASLTVFGPGGFLLIRALQSLKNAKLNMFTLIGMGISSAYFYSVYALFFASTLPESLLLENGSVRLYFVPAAMITTLVILGQYLETRASANAGQAIRTLMNLIPPAARKIKKCCGAIQEINLNEVAVGDLLQILPYDKIPVDGIVVEGSGTVDESMLTGESLPVEKHSGSFLAAGTLNGNSILIMQASKVGSDTMLARIVELVRTARHTRLPIQKLADTVSAFFVPLVLIIALISLGYWGLVENNWAMALADFIAVLLAACPCSLGLAAPLAVMVGVGVGAKNGILIRDPAALENLRKIDTLMLDKTGTLTENTLQVRDIYLAENISRKDFFRIVLALEQNSNHPLAQALLNMPEAEKYLTDLPEVEDFSAFTGQGICGIVDDLRFVLGNMLFMQQENVRIMEFLQANKLQKENISGSSIVLAAAGKVWGMMTFGDIIRSDAPQAIAELKKRSIDLVIISGDSFSAVKHTACSLGVEEFYAELSPFDKLEKIKARQAFGRNVAMLGDGVNDAAALAAADVGIAMGSGADAALENAMITLLHGDIKKMCSLLNLGTRVNRVIKQNLCLAFAYNIIILPWAAGLFYGLVNWAPSPVICSIAMSGSCLLVVGNSMRLWKAAI